MLLFSLSKNCASLLYSHPVLITWKNTMSSSVYSDKLKWDKRFKSYWEWTNKNTVSKILTVLGNLKENNWETEKSGSSYCDEENSTYGVTVNWSTDLLQLKQYTEFLDASMISTFSRNQPLALKQRKKIYIYIYIYKIYLKHETQGRFLISFPNLCGSILLSVPIISNTIEMSIIQTKNKFLQFYRGSLW